MPVPGMVHWYWLLNARTHEDFIVYFWLEYETQLDDLLLKLFFYKAFITLLASRHGFVFAPLCFGAYFLLIQRWKPVLVCCAAAGGSCLLAPGQQLSHSCACGWMTLRCSSAFLATYSNLKYVKVSMCVPRHSLCLLLPLNTYFPHNTDFSGMNFFHQLQWERGLRQHDFSVSLLSLSFSLSGGTSSLIS